MPSPKPEFSTQNTQFEFRKLRLREPFRIAHGISSERVVLRFHSGGAIGEAPFVPYYPDSPEAVRLWLEHTPPLSSATPLADEDAPAVVKLAADLLHHDLEAKTQQVPLWKRLAQPDPRGMRACRSLGIPTNLSDFSEQVRGRARQFQSLKLKLGSGNPDYDEAIVATAREAAPHAVLFGDVNGGWSVSEAIKLLPRMEKFALSFVEQPVHHAGGIELWRELHAARSNHSLPLYADESVQTLADLPALAGLIQGVNIKLLKSKGFAGAIALLAAARSLGLGTLLGCMIESSIGVTAAAHLAGAFDWIDLDGHLYLADDDFEGLSFDSSGRLQLPDRPGIGVIARSKQHF